MAKFNTGSATIDRFLQIKNADESFYKYIGQENFASLVKTCHPDDLDKLNAAVEELKINGHSMLAYRIRRIDGKYRWVLAELEYETIELDGEQLININFQDVQALEREVNEIKNENAEVGEFFSMLDELFFLYNIDEDDLRVFIGGNKQNYDVIHCTLEEWIRQVEDNHYVPSEHMELFKALCSDFRCGTRTFTYEILSSQFSANQKIELNLIKGKTIRDLFRERKVIGYISTISEESKKKSVNYNIESNMDVATDLLNKKAVTSYATRLISSGTEHNVHLCIVDLDNFKNINDTYGHMFGDEVLVTVASILKEAVGDRGVVGRIGGDEMMIVLEKVENNSELRAILRAIRSNVEWAYKGKLDGINLTTSIGVASYPMHGKNYDDIFCIADKMLYRAKKKGKNRYIIYTKEVHGDINDLESEDNENKIVPSGHVDKECLVMRLITYLLHKEVMPYEAALQEVGEGFKLDEINVFYGNTDRIMLQWNTEYKKNERILTYIHKDSFEELFDSKGIAVIDNISNIENRCPEAYKYLSEIGVKAAVIYRMTEANKEGYIAYYKMASVSRKWSDSDKAYLNFIGKIIELSIDGR